MLGGGATAGVAAYLGNAPIYSPYFEDWKQWAMLDKTTSGALLLGLVVLVIGVLGMLIWMVRPRRSEREPLQASPHIQPVLTEASPEDPAFALPEGQALVATSSETPSVRRGALKFDASDLSKEGEQPILNLDSRSASEEQTGFADNAPDGFLPPPVKAPEFSGAEIIPLNAATTKTGTSVPTTEPVGMAQPSPEPLTAVALPNPETDPVGTALLSEAPELPSNSAPESDINAVVHSAMSLISAPEVMPEGLQIGATPPLPEPVQPALNAEALINTTLETALNHWPEATRSIARQEVHTRLNYLYHNEDPQARSVFTDLSKDQFDRGLSGLNALAQARTAAGNRIEAADLWRAFAALNMGRDDHTALMAYEKVSDLDPNDGVIHTYLVHRYTVEGREGAIRPMLMRALGAIQDQAQRAPLLQQFGDLSLKVADHPSAGRAFEELAQIQTSLMELNPDNLSLRSGRAVTLARLAQIREMEGRVSEAGPLYRQAHNAFADLSARIPNHAGLISMAENAGRDALRLGA